LLLKKVSQLAVIAAVEPAGAADAEPVEAGDVVGAAGEDEVADDGGVELEPLGLPFPQAAAVAASAASAQAPTRRVICR